MGDGAIADKDVSGQAQDIRPPGLPEIPGGSRGRWQNLQRTPSDGSARRKEATHSNMGRYPTHLGYQHAHRGSGKALPVAKVRTRKTAPGPDVRTMRGNSRNRSYRGSSYPGAQRPGEIHRSREAAMGTDHGFPEAENARSVSYLPYGHSIWTLTPKQGITFTDRQNLMMLESVVR